MTVQRHSDDYFEVPLAMVANAVRKILASKPPYRNTTEIEKDKVFKTNVKPGWWLMGTDMTINLISSSGGTNVVVETKSQLFIVGDVFDYYNRYIRYFMRELRIHLKK
jgi:hypothetical protein